MHVGVVALLTSLGQRPIHLGVTEFSVTSLRTGYDLRDFFNVGKESRQEFIDIVIG